MMSWFQPMCGTFRPMRGIDIESNAFAGKNAQAAVFAVLVADIEKHLQSQADSQKKLPFFDVPEDGLGEFSFADCGDGIPESADAGDDQFIGPVDFLGSGNDLRLGSGAGERLLHRAAGWPCRNRRLRWTLGEV